MLLLHHDRESGLISLRHYAISAAPSGGNRAIKQLLQRKAPTLGGLQDIADFVAKAGYGSVSRPSYTLPCPEPSTVRPLPVANFVAKGRLSIGEPPVHCTALFS